jgi:predicted 2-oxoglutarate/Fe(II)-dependent dioxygenase YbiX
VVLWAQSMVRDVGQRAILHTLDQSIQNIRLEMPGSKDIDQLLATYNNLLRMWAGL